jgi:hypothetical protein
MTAVTQLAILPSKNSATDFWQALLSATEHSDKMLLSVSLGEVPNLVFLVVVVLCLDSFQVHCIHLHPIIQEVIDCKQNTAM